MEADDGTKSKYITLISREGYEFVVLREAAAVSSTIRKMVNGMFSESETGRCHFEDINGVVLSKVVEYFHYWYKHRDDQDVPDLEIPTELCLEILMAADFLGLDKIA
ncbi:hypothetical protein MCOR27_000652 [Pyricularia oryzae]|uniref:Elongin-C n=5 Tax=Pyricularia TaxID=48558 RepID=A0ABQ8NIX1_PYRGI|nr:uncharacterized protein MGG_03902 [Pyricularia oryzae 70-15]ELQ39728.1 hypothetical protein OOU_Y34scaffold00487g73 [Pyricularia oryzae Y34]KAH8846103.1 hypothetical protein MCOR01_003312 [Pyricularia oryzae]KAI6297832.1 hypothetical protein MCOR33_005925 [Pyricularia grisea]EHA47606.1 hypothetical protein MGG_03902 [Pyricularia oryzae 70-15]KAH9432389.1 hypothetical protein MCOR02_007090 [Pyricularia oryzae]